jgi:MSHA biogenesis protein MshI
VAIFSFLKRASRPGCLAVGLRPEAAELALVQRQAGAKPALLAWVCGDLPAGETPERYEALGNLAAQHELSSCRCTTLLVAGEYQLLQAPAPNVPEKEMAEALRWQLKDLADIEPDSVGVDVLPFPDAAKGRQAQVFLATAEKRLLQTRIQGFQAAGLNLQVIDLPELAQRNVAALFEEEKRGLAFLVCHEDHSLLTFTHQGELFAFRRIEIGFRHFAQADGDRREQLCERVVLELQRSLDTVDRQFGAISLSRLLVVLPPETGLEDQLRNSLYLPFDACDLAEVMDFTALPEFMERERQRQSLLILGAALRDEGGA